jgi:hypothetical protein
VLVQARGRKVDLRVSSISPGVVETEFLAVHGFGDEAAAKERYACPQRHAQHFKPACCHQPSVDDNIFNTY